jgi:hypothetical protein
VKPVHTIQTPRNDQTIIGGSLGILKSMLDLKVTEGTQRLKGKCNQNNSPNTRGSHLISSMQKIHTIGGILLVGILLVDFLVALVNKRFHGMLIHFMAC